MEAKARWLDRIRLYTCALKSLSNAFFQLVVWAVPAACSRHRLNADSLHASGLLAMGPGCALRLFPGVLTDLFAEVETLSAMAARVF